MKNEKLLKEIVKKIMDDHEKSIYWDTGNLEQLEENIKKGIVEYHEKISSDKNEKGEFKPIISPLSKEEKTANYWFNKYFNEIKIEL